MDRRSFNKTLAGIAATLTLPFKAAPVEAATLPFVPGNCLLLPPPAMVGHHGFTSMNLTTSFQLEQVFEGGLLDKFEEIANEDPEVEMELSFYLDKENKVERTVYFEGMEKQWIMDIVKQAENDTPMLQGVDDTGSRIYLGTQEIRVYYPDSNGVRSAKRVSPNQIKKDEKYTIEVDVNREGSYYRLELRDFTAIDLQDYDDDNDIISQGITK